MELDRGHGWELRVQVALWNAVGPVVPRLGDILTRTSGAAARLLTRRGFSLSQHMDNRNQLVSILDNYPQTLLSNLWRFQEPQDKSSAGVVRVSCVNCLAHLAVICEVLGRIEPTLQTKMDTLCDPTLEQLGALAQDMCMEEYATFGLLLGVCIVL